MKWGHYGEIYYTLELASVNSSVYVLVYFWVASASFIALLYMNLSYYLTILIKWASVYYSTSVILILWHPMAKRKCSVSEAKMKVMVPSTWLQGCGLGFSNVLLNYSWCVSVRSSLLHYQKINSNTCNFVEYSCWKITRNFIHGLFIFQTSGTERDDEFQRLFRGR